MATAEATQEKTGLGNYFVANYPPFSFWKPAHLPEAREALQHWRDNGPVRRPNGGEAKDDE